MCSLQQIFVLGHAVPGNDASFRFRDGAGTLAEQALLRKLEEEVIRIVQAPDFKERMNALQVNPEAIPSEPFKAMIQADLERWSAVAKAGNIKPAN